ncbi:hypothetical protein HD806DRAFT_473681 [Xylariaceae sp. AK1471]|nr:hypothetical protein HD806DRAFT_473681 [Xylariaceae sp. AK1471]
MRRRPLPLMAEARQETQLALQPSRIKRNSACTSCRDAKVRCNPSSNSDQPCQRCAKLHLTCVVDKSHKRISRRRYASNIFCLSAVNKFSALAPTHIYL